MKGSKDESFREKWKMARDRFRKGEYRAAFEVLVNEPTRNVQELFTKIGFLIDVGLVLRDEKILQYGIYLLEKQKEEINVVPEYIPLVHLNLANQYSNMASLYSYHDDFQQYYQRKELTSARLHYETALAGCDSGSPLRAKILLPLADTLLNLGRGWEALSRYQEYVALSPGEPDPLVRKSALMNRYAPFNADNRDIIWRESWHIMQKIRELDRDNRFLSEMEREEGFLLGKCPRDFLDAEEVYPRETIDKGTREHLFHISFCVKNRLYINACSFCSRCDFAIGDRAVLDTRNLTLSGRGEKRYYHLALLINRMKEEFITGRFLLVLSQYDRKDLQYAEMFNLVAALENYEPANIKRTLLKKTYILGWELLRLVTQFLQVFTGHNPGRSVSMAQVFREGGKIRESIRRSDSPSLHALYDIFCDLHEGDDRYLNETYLLLQEDNLFDLPGSVRPAALSGTRGDLADLTIRLYRILKNIILYAMSMVEEEGMEERKIMPAFTLYPFEIPDNLRIN
jgi:hypothetical protein